MGTSLFVTLLFIFLACGYILKPFYKYIIFYDKEYMRVEQLKPVLEKVKNEMDEGDGVYIHPRATVAYIFYNNILNKQVAQGSITNFLTTHSDSMVWIIFSHLNEVQRRKYLYSISKESELLLTILEPGASAYLFDLSSH